MNNKIPFLLTAPALVTLGAIVAPVAAGQPLPDPPAQASATQTDPAVEAVLVDRAQGLDLIDPGVFRSIFAQYLETLGDNFPSGRALARTQVERVYLLSDQDLEILIRFFPDPARFQEGMLRTMALLQRNLEQRPDLQASVPGCVALASPDYGSNANGSNYQSRFLSFLWNNGFLPSPFANTARCDNEAYASFTDDLVDLQIANLIGDAACQVAGCDPIGFVCAATCAADAILDGSTDLLLLISATCDAHNATVDSAEIEAAYENSIVISGQVCDLDSSVASGFASQGAATAALQASLDDHDQNLAAHDANIDADLLEHDQNLDDHDQNLSDHDLNLTVRANSIDMQLAAIAQAIQDAQELNVRMHIERNLSQLGPLVENRIVLFELPAAVGGELETVRDIVAESLTDVSNTGPLDFFAQLWFQQGQSAYAQGNWKLAYDHYRLAYQAAAKR